MLTRTTAVADAILAILDATVPHELATRLFVEPYANLREFGWTVRTADGSRKVSFAENGNADEAGDLDKIVVYQNIGDTTYRRPTYLPARRFMRAAHLVQDYLAGKDQQA